MALLTVLTALPALAAPIRHAGIDVQLYGVAPIASHARRALPGLMAAALAAEPVDGFPPGARLVLRVREVYLSSDLGSDSGSAGVPDAISGEAIVLSARGQPITTRPVIAHVKAPGSALMVTPGSEERRVQLLFEAIAINAVRALR